MINTNSKLRFIGILISILIADFHFLVSVVEDYYSMLETVDDAYKKILTESQDEIPEIYLDEERSNYDSDYEGDDIDIKPEDLDEVEIVAPNRNDSVEKRIAEIIQVHIEEKSDAGDVRVDLRSQNEGSKKSKNKKNAMDQSFFNILKSYKLLTGGGIVVIGLLAYLFYKKEFKSTKSDVQFLK